MGSPVVSVVLLIGTSVFLVWMSRAATRPDVDPLRTPGIRTAHTQASREAWLAAHRAIAGRLRMLGLVLGAYGAGIAVIRILGLIDDRAVDIATLIGFGVAVVGVASMVGPANRAARALRED